MGIWRFQCFDGLGVCLSRSVSSEYRLKTYSVGNYVSNYHWQDGIGPMEDRPKRIELAWLSDESNLSVDHLEEYTS